MSDGAVEFLVTFADLVRIHGPGGGDPSASRRVEAASGDGTRDGAVRVRQAGPDDLLETRHQPQGPAREVRLVGECNVRMWEYGIAEVRK